MNAWAQKEGLPGMGYIFWRDGEQGLEAAGPVAKNIGPERTEAIRRSWGWARGRGVLPGGQARRLSSRSRGGRGR
jgi:aspartyl-tRNA synthetase